MKKIGIVTFHRADNYGAVLQVLALQEKCQEKNDTFIIDYDYKLISEKNKAIRKPSKISIKAMYHLLYDLINFKKKYKRHSNFEKFRNEYLNLTKYYDNAKSLENDYPDFDIYITGSDQVWNTEITNGLSDIYTLNFGEKTTKRISYAASMGNSEIKENEKEIYYNKLKKIDFISVREKSTARLLSNILGKNIEEVLDPTLLITKEKWEKLIVKEKKISKPYILAYVIESNEEYVKIVNNLSEKTGLKVIHFEKKNIYNNVLKNMYTASPFEFVSLIKNAEYIVATSFHATVFSIIYNKKFFIIPHRKTGERVTNLLDKLGITGRTFYSYDEFKNIDYDFDTNWNKVNKKLEKERNYSLNWLNNAIEGKEEKSE